jgi:hypothetical protein
VTGTDCKLCAAMPLVRPLPYRSQPPRAPESARSVRGELAHEPWMPCFDGGSRLHPRPTDLHRRRGSPGIVETFVMRILLWPVVSLAL